MSEELKACPFCGGRAIVVPVYVDTDLTRPKWFTAECLASVGKVTNGRHDKKEQAIKAWNTRPLEDELVTALETVLDVLSDLESDTYGKSSNPNAEMLALIAKAKGST